MAATATAADTREPAPTASQPPPPASPTPQTVGQPLSGTPRPTVKSSTRATSTATAPPPTFTPPPPPPPVVGEHLFLLRPVPAAGPTWTDKAYPYGSTRGGRLRPHHGVEFTVPSGTPVLAVADGTVVVAGDDSATSYGPQTDFYGNLVVLQLAAAAGDVPVYVLYGHMSAVGVEVGQAVVTGEALGLSGDSGVADGPHVHLEVRVGENSYLATRNPLLWLAPLPDTGVVAGRVTNPSGALLHEALVTLQRVDAPAAYTATTSYAADGPRADGQLMENFAVDDVAPGFYQVIVSAGSRRYTADLWVFGGGVNWVEISVGP